MTQIFIYRTPGGTQVFNDPGNWVAAGSMIECVGCGGVGGRGAGGCVNTQSGAGGGGGSYSFAANVTPTFPVQYQANNASATSWWNGSTQSPGNVIGDWGRQAGSNNITGTTTPGAGGTITYPAGFVGAAGGAGVVNNQGAGGGGGAGGMHGAGSAGVAGSGATSGVGGAGDGGRTPGGALNSTAPGTQWDHLHGIGGGGGGGTTASTNLGVGGNFGGGGGGGFAITNSGGAGGGCLIVVTYTPRTSTQIFLYAGVTRFPNPGNWTAVNNQVEVVGTGGWGPQYFMTNPPCPVRQGAGGGGGGAYASTINSAPTFPAAVQIAVGQSLSGINNYWNAQASSPGNVWAGCGGPGSVGGGSGNVTGYPNPVAGGQGGNPSGQTGGGGGGAGGMHGVGSIGSGIVGGAGDAGNTPQQGTNGGVGNSGTQWDNIHGIGGGGAGNANGPGGIGGNFGAGGGGGSGNNATANPNNFGPGIVVLTYTPALVLAPRGQAQIMA